MRMLLPWLLAIPLWDWSSGFPSDGEDSWLLFCLLRQLFSLLNRPGLAAAKRTSDFTCLQGEISQASEWSGSHLVLLLFYFFFHWSFSLSWSPASSHSLNVAVMMRKWTLEWYICSRGKAFFICISEWINSIPSVNDIGKQILAVLISTFAHRDFAKLLLRN